MPSDSYRIHAVQYGYRETTTSEVFPADRRHEPLGMSYFIWAVTNDEHTVIVDLGFTEPEGTRRGRQFLRHPAEGLAALDIDGEQVEHVIVTHFHYDHTGHHALFPHATFHIQESEMRFYTGPNVRYPSFGRGVTLDDILAFVRLNYAGRVRLVDGEAQILPGINVHHVGGHTAGMQIVSVQTAHGRAVLASDAAHYYRELEEQIVFAGAHDLPGIYRGFERVRELADAPDLIIPGHDPLVLERLHTVGPGIVELRASAAAATPAGGRGG